jgi:putative spermidine/putrescine transport system permease protein
MTKRALDRIVRSLPGILLGAYVLLVCLFAVLPIAVILLTSFSSELFVRFPPESYGVRQYVELFRDDSFWRSLTVSLIVAVGTSIVAALAGTLAAFALVRTEFFAKNSVRALLLGSLAIPGALIGVGILQITSDLGWPVAPWGLMLGHLTTSLPFLVGFAIASLTGMPQRIEWAGQSLGSNPIRTFFTITLPVIAPGIIGGTMFAFIHSFDETDVSLFTTRGDWTTLPVKIFHDAYEQAPTTTAASGVMAAAALLTMLMLEWRARMISHLLSRGGVT